MADGTCSLPDCERGGRLRRGWCNSHYLRWLRYGDPLASSPQNDDHGTRCSVDECGRRAVARGWCNPHWKRWQRHGDPTHRNPGEVRDGKRICPMCGEDKPRDAEHFHRDRACPDGLRPICAACCRRQVAERHPYVPKPKALRPCDSCLRLFMADKRRSRYCEDCSDQADRLWREQNPDKVWKIGARRRARERAAFVEDVDRAVVFARDDWTCQICMEPLDRDAVHPEALSPTVDHVVPLARGGEHSYANVQAAHFRCNLLKGCREEET